MESFCNIVIQPNLKRRISCNNNFPLKRKYAKNTKESKSYIRTFHISCFDGRRFQFEMSLLILQIVWKLNLSSEGFQYNLRILSVGMSLLAILSILFPKNGQSMSYLCLNINIQLQMTNPTCLWTFKTTFIILMAFHCRHR